MSSYKQYMGYGKNWRLVNGAYKRQVPGHKQPVYEWTAMAA